MSNKKSRDSSSDSSSSDEEEVAAEKRHRHRQRENARQLRRVEDQVSASRIILAEKHRLLCQRRLALVTEELAEVERERTERYQRKRDLASTHTSELHNRFLPSSSKRPKHNDVRRGGPDVYLGKDRPAMYQEPTIHRPLTFDDADTLLYM